MNTYKKSFLEHLEKINLLFNSKPIEGVIFQSINVDGTLDDTFTLQIQHFQDFSARYYDMMSTIFTNIKKYLRRYTYLSIEIDSISDFF